MTSVLTYFEVFIFSFFFFFFFFLFFFCFVLAVCGTRDVCIRDTQVYGQGQMVSFAFSLSQHPTQQHPTRMGEMNLNW